MHLIFDTETTGFPSKTASISAQPHIVQIAMLLVDDNLTEMGCFSTLIKSTGWTIHPGAQEKHGISVEMCNQFGVPIEYAESVFNDWYWKSNKVVAHNVAFDSQLINFERERLLGRNDYIWDKSFCTMNAMTPICKLPPRFPGTQYKWPKLSEAYQHCFQKMFDKAHDALADVRATAQVLQWLVTNKHATL